MKQVKPVTLPTTSIVFLAFKMLTLTGLMATRLRRGTFAFTSDLLT